jgi:hypothetical protein
MICGAIRALSECSVLRSQRERPEHQKCRLAVAHGLSKSGRKIWSCTLANRLAERCACKDKDALRSLDLQADCETDGTTISWTLLEAVQDACSGAERKLRWQNTAMQHGFRRAVARLSLRFARKSRIFN